MIGSRYYPMLHGASKVMSKSSKVPYYGPGETECKVSLKEFMEVVVPARLRHAGDTRRVRADRTKKRMKVVGGTWVNVEESYEQYAQAHRTGRASRMKVVINNLLNMLWGRPVGPQPGEAGFLPSQFIYGPTFGDEIGSLK
jgi:hypothetical protein